MPDSHYFSKLRAFLSGRRRSQSTGYRWAKRRAVSAHSAATFALESLEPRVLLAADLAGAVQTTQVMELAPVESQPAAVLVLNGQTTATDGVQASQSTTTFTATYDASSGAFPDAVFPPWTLFDGASPENPSLSGGKLILSTSDSGENMFYTHSAPDIDVHDPLIVEARVKFVSGQSTGSFGSVRAPIFIAATTSPSEGNVLFIGRDEIFILAADGVRGQTAFVDTDNDFHTYRMEISAGAVTVFYDGQPTLSGSTFVNPASHGSVERVSWGEGSSFAFGTSEWEFVRHNAEIKLTPPNRAPVVNDQMFPVAENSPNGTVVGTIAVTDPDVGDTRTFAVTGGTGQSAFAVNATSGQITVADGTLLNFENTPSFTLNVQVTDAGNLSDTAVITIDVSNVNERPVANAGADQTVLGGTLVTLDGTASADPEGQTLSFAWTLAKPAGSTAVIANPTASKPTFTPDVVGGYTVQLVVTDPQGLSSTADTVQITANPLPVQIDIRPGELPNNINLGSGGVVQVAILSTNTFNAPRDVDPVSVTLASASVRLRGNGTPTTTVRDVNGDGLDDLIVHVNTEALQLSETATQATLDGKTFGGIPIRGTDSIRVVP